MSQVVKKLNRRQFLSLTAATGGALVLTACGGSAAAPAPTVVPPTPLPTPDPNLKVMVGDVLDYVLESADWPGDFGKVTFRLHRAMYNGEPIYHIRTDTSDSGYAEAEGLVYVPLLNTANGADIANKLYIFNHGAPNVMQYAPGDEMFSSLFQIHNVTVEDRSVAVDSIEAVEAAAENGALTIEPTTIMVNFPIIQWPGGALTVDPELEAPLGPGQLFEEPNMDDMTVSMKLHQCYPGSRYIVTDTSAAPMAPMMAINASPVTQALKERGATDEIWVFANGIAGSGVMGFQPAVFDNKAGEPAWSPFWDHFTVKWVDESQAKVLKTSTEIRDLIESGDLELFNGVPNSHPNGFIVNCPAPILAPNTFEA